MIAAHLPLVIGGAAALGLGMLALHVLSEGGQIKWVQVYSVARPPSESCVTALGDRELDAIASRVRDALSTVRVEVYYGADVPPQRP